MTASTRLPPTAAERAGALLLNGMEASRRLGVSRRTLARWVSAGALLPVRPRGMGFPHFRMADIARLSQSTLNMENA